MLRIGCATFSFGELTLEESAEVVKALGFNLVDVGAGWGKYQQVPPAEAAEDPQRHADVIRKWMDRHGLAISELFVMQFEDPVNHPDPASRARTRKRFEGLASFCQKAGFESIMMLPGPVNEDLGQTAEAAFDTSVAELQKMVAVARERGIQCNVEPNGGSVAGKPDDGARLCEAVPGLGLTLDYAHQLQLGFTADEIEPMHKYSKHFHAKQSAPGSFMAKADEGAIDFRRLIRKLKAENYEGVVCVEFVTRQELIDQGWDFKVETRRLKEILEEALYED